MIIKNTLLQAYIKGENLYSPDFSGAVAATWKYWIYYIAMVLVILGVSLLFKKDSWRNAYVVIWNIIFTVLVCVDIIYARSFFTMPSAVDVYILKNFSGFDGGEVESLLCGYDVIFFIDIIVLILFICKFKRRHIEEKKKKKILFRSGLIVIGCCVTVLLTIPLQSRLFHVDTSINNIESPEDQVAFLSSLGYHVKDVYELIEESTKDKLSSNEKTRVDKFFQWKNEDIPDNEYKGIFEGKNVLFLQIESLESFVINQTIDGQEITPNINKLTKNGFTFKNIFEQVQGGNSSDADLMYTTSRLPVTKGSTFFRYSDVKLNSLPRMLKERGYDMTYHQAIRGGFWNYQKAWSDMIGVDNFVGSEKYDMSGEKIGFTLNDKDYLNQVFPYLEKLQQPYYAHVVCNSSHMPFKINDPSIKELKLDSELDESYLGGYLQLCRYVDTQIGILLEKMDKAGLLDNTVIVVIGDHTGIHKYYEYSLEQWYDKYPWVNVNNYYTVPFVISCDSVNESVTSDVLAGQIDVMPTLAYLLGIDENQYKDDAMGRNLLKTDRSYAIFRDGTVYSENLKKEDIDIIKTSYDVSESLFQTGK